MRWVVTISIVIALATAMWAVRRYVSSNERYDDVGVVFHTQCNYKGAATKLAIGRYTVGTLLLLGIDHDWNGSSLKVPSGMQVTIVAKDGTVHKLDADTPCFGSRVLPLLDAYVVESVRIVQSSSQ